MLRAMETPVPGHRRPSRSERVGAFAADVVKEFREDRILFMSSALTFDVLLASIPFLMLLLTVVGLGFEIIGGGELDLHAMLGTALPEAGGSDVDPLGRVERLLEGVAQRRTTVSLITLPLFLLLSTRMFATVRRVLDDVFHATGSRRYLHRKLVDLGLMLATAAFLLLNGLATVSIGIVTAAVEAPWLARGAVTAVTFLSALSLFVIVYRVAPDREIDWRTAGIAGLCCAVFFELAKAGYAVYLDYAVRSAALTPDAQLGGVMLLLAWLYLTSVVFLSAAELADKYAVHTGRTARPPG